MKLAGIISLLCCGFEGQSLEQMVGVSPDHRMRGGMITSPLPGYSGLGPTERTEAEAGDTPTKSSISGRPGETAESMTADYCRAAAVRSARRPGDGRHGKG